MGVDKKEVILVGASWCGACKGMQQWFFNIELPSVTLRYADVSEFPESNITSLPTILFLNEGEEIQRISGALSQSDLIIKICSIFKI